MTDEVANPFSGDMSIQRQHHASTAIGDVAIQREIAEVQGAVIIARRYPRNLKEVADKILMACRRPTLAAEATYEYARGGSEITGPSIRLAEAIAQNYENLQFGIRELEQRDGESTVEAYAWDLQTNVRQSKVFQVRHVRATRKGTYNLTDPRDIYELTANQGARRLRACILGVIPGDVVEAAVEQCEKTILSSVKINDETIADMLERFAGFGITKIMIEKRIQRSLDTIKPAQWLKLRKIYTSLKDNMSAPSDWFDVPQAPAQASGAAGPKSGAEATKEAINKAKGGETPPPRTREPGEDDAPPVPIDDVPL